MIFASKLDQFKALQRLSVSGSHHVSTTELAELRQLASTAAGERAKMLASTTQPEKAQQPEPLARIKTHSGSSHGSEPELPLLAKPKSHLTSELFEFQTQFSEEVE